MPVADIYSYGKLFTNDFGSTTTHYARLVEDWTINQHLVNHLNFGYTRRFRIEEGPDGVGQWESKLDFHGDFEDILIPNMGTQYGVGNIPVPPGDEGRFTDNSYEFDEALTWITGNHALQFGVGHRRQGFSAYYYSNAAADFSFTNALTSAGNNAAGQPIDPNSGLGAVSLFLGAASTGTIGGPSLASMRARYWDFYGQDDWKLSPKLTMNAGLRYEIPDPVEEVQCRTSQVNFTLPNPGADNLPGAMEFQGSGTGRDGRCSPMNHYWGSWGPRLGLVYQVDNKTVVRAAYGIYYTPSRCPTSPTPTAPAFSRPAISGRRKPTSRPRRLFPARWRVIPACPRPSSPPPLSTV